MRTTTSGTGLSYGLKSGRVQFLTATAASVLGILILAAIGCETTAYFTRNKDTTSKVDSVESALAAIRESRDPGLRRAAFEFLGETKHLHGDAAERDEISGILALAYSVEADVQTRIAILGSVARLESPKRVEVFIQAAADKDPSVRMASCRHLGHVASPQAAAQLDQLLVSDTNIDVRLAAADALGKISTRESAMSLLGGIEDSDVALRYRCRESLKQITGKDHAGNVAEWREEIQTANFEQPVNRNRKLDFVK